MPVPRVQYLLQVRDVRVSNDYVMPEDTRQSLSGFLKAIDLDRFFRVHLIYGTSRSLDHAEWATESDFRTLMQQVREVGADPMAVEIEFGVILLEGDSFKRQDLLTNEVITITHQAYKVMMHVPTSDHATQEA